MTQSRTIATPTHGRYLVIPSSAPKPAPLLVGFHGYAEDAETQLERLRVIPGSENWRCVSIQGLHRFYQRRTGQVVANWMTSQDRELAIADNLSYVNSCIDSVMAEWPTAPGIVLAGFSQGAAMAWRAAIGSPHPVAGVITAGGDVPPEISAASLALMPAALIARGRKDTLYPMEKFAEDGQRLREAGVPVRVLEFDGGHEWSSELIEAASSLLRDVAAR